MAKDSLTGKRGAVPPCTSTQAADPQMHGIEGEAFGLPFPGKQFPSWGQAVIHYLENVIAGALDAGLRTDDL